MATNGPSITSVDETVRIFRAGVLIAASIALVVTACGDGESESTTADPSLSRFYDLWVQGDFDAMSSIAAPGAIQEAEQWGRAESVGEVSCSTGTCELLVVIDGTGLIFNVAYDEPGLLVRELVFGGDAG